MSSLPPDPYKILGVTKDAQVAEIRSAHRKLVLKCHPDKVQDPALKAQKQDEFQKVQQAYELLSDDKERQKYDDKVHLADLRKQYQNRANTSSARSSPRYAEYEIRTAEPRPTTFKSPSAPSPAGLKTHSYQRSWEADVRSRGGVFFEEIRTSRRESGPEKPSKREAARDRERKEKERDSERDRKRREEKEDNARRLQEEAKKREREERKQREKQRDKQLRRETSEKHGHNKAYVEPYDEDEVQPRSIRKKTSGGKKHDEKRERSSHLEEIPRASPPPMPERTPSTLDYAASYIEASRAKGSGRSSSFRYPQPSVQPPAPTPPPAQSPSAYATPDDDVRRSSARSRREASDSPKPPRERSHKKSREPINEAIIEDAGLPLRPAMHKSTTSMGARATSPPRGGLPRQNSMPAEASYTRPVPGISRAQTIGIPGESREPRGRGRSRHHAQIPDSDIEEDVEAVPRERERDRKHRNKKHRSPDPYYENAPSSRYAVRDGKTTRLPSSYAREYEMEPESYRYYEVPQPRVIDVEPPTYYRDSGYSNAHKGFTKIKTSKMPLPEDIKYSSYPHQSYREGYSVAG